MKSLKHIKPDNWNLPLNKFQYVAEINRKNRTSIMFLVDQSGSMGSNKQVYRGVEKTFAQIVADMINELLNELIGRCTKSEGVRDYFDVCVIGYGGKSSDYANIIWEENLAGHDWVGISDLKHNAKYEKKTVVKTIRGVNKTSEIDVPYWFKPTANFKTPMGDAFIKAHELLSDWIIGKGNHESYPPVVINITDGMQTDCTDEELVESAQKVQALNTKDGHIIVLNCHINLGAGAVLFPYSVDELPDNQYSKRLYEMSSIMPPSYSLDISKMRKDSDIFSDYRGMSFNMNVDSLFNMFDIGTSGATKQLNNGLR